jgi:hypothetical protein
MTRTAHRLPRWQHAVLVVVGGLALTSGIAWLLLHYAWTAADGLPHPAEGWLMKLHGLAGFGGLFLFGMLAASHVPQGWRLAGRHRRAQQRGSGIALCALATGLAASGYLLYYFAPEPVRPTLGWLHAAIGVAMAGLVWRHRRRRSGVVRGRDGRSPNAT